jgi:hypothetical protein
MAPATTVIKVEPEPAMKRVIIPIIVSGKPTP